MTDNPSNDDLFDSLRSMPESDVPDPASDEELHGVDANIQAQEIKDFDALIAPMLDEEAKVLQLLESIVADEPTYDLDSDIESAPAPPPDPNLTAADVALWMQSAVTNRNHLSQQEAVHHISVHFGKKYVYPNKNGHQSIDKEVLTHCAR